MANTTTVNDRYTDGVSRVSVVEIDITSLAAAGSEAWDPAAETHINNAETVSVVSAPKAYNVVYDDDAGAFTVVAVADGTDVASGTAVGVVKAKVVGRR